jgi:hypothetical protein
MKNRILFLFSFLVILCIGHLTAQEDALASSSIDQEAMEMAAKAAEQDDTIEKVVDSDSGVVSYYKVSTCTHSGTTKKTQVKWDSASAQFVNMKATSSKKGCDPKACSGKKGAKKGCCSKSKSRNSSASVENMTNEAKSDVEILNASAAQ